MNDDIDLLDIDILSSDDPNNNENLKTDPFNGNIQQQENKFKKKKSTHIKTKKNHHNNHQNGYGLSNGYSHFNQKVNLTREERKNLMAMQIFAKMEQNHLKKTDEGYKKKKKINPESSDQSVNLGNGSELYNANHEQNSKTEPNPASNQILDSESLPQIKKQASKKQELKVLSHYINPNFDLKNHNALISFLYEYQRDQLEKRKHLHEDTKSNASSTHKSESNSTLSSLPDQEINQQSPKKIFILSDKFKIESYRKQCLTLLEKFDNFVKLQDVNQLGLSNILEAFLFYNSS